MTRLQTLPKTERPDAGLDVPEDASFCVPEDLRGITVEDLSHRLTVGAVTLEEVDALERLCALGRHARHLRELSAGRMPLVQRGRIIDAVV